MISPLLKDIVQSEKLALQRTASLREVVDLMNANRKGVVAVLDGKRPVGILTERDVVEILYKGCDFDDAVDRFTKKDLVMTYGERAIGYALNLTIENNIRRIVIIDKKGNFLGIITQQDLLSHLEEDIYRSTLQVKHIIEKRGAIIGVSSQDSLRDVLAKMIAHKISSLPVMDGYRAIGIITEKDILQLAGKKISLNGPVHKYMSSPVITAGLDTSLVDVVKTMQSRNIRRVVVVNKDGLTVSMVTIRDVLRNLEGDYNKFLERKLRSAKDVLNLLPEMLIEVTDTGKEQLIIWANEKALNKFGWQILDKSVTDFIPVESWKQINRAIHTLRKIENIMFKKEKEVFELSGFFMNVDSVNEKGRYQLILRDITEDVHLSTTDPLTSMYNRRFINEFIVKEIERSKRSKKKFSIVICDLDDFKKINDAHGHLAGDNVLKAFCQVVTTSLRKLDVVGRYGGDEFAMILPETTNDIACMIISRLKEAVAGLKIQIQRGKKVTLSTSFGVSTYPDDGLTSEDLLVRTDERLLLAKSRGKNQVVCAD
jgi:diguanylate cyclase (GGDEF)-like protein